MTKQTSRERTFQWSNPLEGASQGKQLSGIDYLTAMKEGKIPLPPLLHTLDFEVGDIKKGQVSFFFRPQEFHYNPIGTVHGGVISAILDSAMGCTVHSMLEAGTGYTTLELKVNFLKAITTQNGHLKAEGKVIHAGGRTALVEAQLTDEKVTVYAHGVSTCMILK